MPLRYASADEKDMCSRTMGMAGMHEKMIMKDKTELEKKFFQKAGFIYQYSEELQITETQLDKIEELKSRLKKNAIMKDAEIKVLGLDIMDELKKEEVDMNAVDKLIDKKYELKKQKTKDVLGAYFELRQILTKEQIEKAKDIQKKYWSEKKEMMAGEKEGTGKKAMKKKTR